MTYRYKPNAIYEAARRNQHARTKPRVAVLGDENNNIYSDRPSFYFARPVMGADENGNARLGPTFYLRANPGAGILNRAGRRVYYKKNEEGEEQITRADPKDLDEQKINQIALEPNDAYRGFRYLFEIVNLSSYSIGSDLLVNVYPWQYQTSDNTVHHFVGTDATTQVNLADNAFIGASAITAGRTAILPTTEETHRYALLAFNVTKHLADDYPLEIYPGVAVAIVPNESLTINEDLQTCYDVLPTDEIVIPIKAYYLAYGQEAIAGISKDIDVRQFINVPGSGSGAPDDATYIIQTADGDLPNAQVLGALGTGLVKNTTTTGVLSIATASDIPNLPASKITTGQLAVARGGTGADLSITGGGGGGFAHQPSLGAAITIRKIVYADLPPTLATYATSGIVGPSDIDALYNVYLNASGEWCAIDTNAVPAEVGRVRGVNANYAEPGDSPIILIHGVQSGYSGLTPGLPLYATNTPGGYSQTPPALTVGGGQIVLCQMGIALTATEVWIDPKPVEFIIRDNLADTDTLTLEHYDDARRERVPAAYIATTLSAAIETYATSNQDNSAQLKGISGAGALVTVDTAGTTLARLGNNGSAQFEEAQAVTLTAGRLSGITFALGANTGSPTGDLTIELRASSGALPGGIPSTVLWTTTHTPTASANNTVTVTNGPLLDAGLYWLNIRATTQASNVGYNLQYNNGSVYAGGVLKADSSASPGTWATFGTTQDLRCTVTTSAAVANDGLSQGVSHSSTTTVPYVDLYLKRTGTLSGNLTAALYSNTAGMPNAAITNGTSSTVAASSVTTGWTLIRFTFPTPPSITASTQYHIVLTTSDSASNANYIEWGTDTSSPGYANGAVALLQSAAWAAASPAADACFTLYGISTTYDQPIGSVGFGSDVLDTHYGDVVYADQDTTTTFTNVYGATLDVACIVRMD